MKAVTRRVQSLSRMRRWLFVAPLILLALAAAVYLRLAYYPTERALQTASLSELQAAAKSDPYNPRVFYHLGLRYRESGQMREACKALRAAAARDTGSETYFLAWADATQARGAESEAFGILTTFLKQHPDSARAHLARARLFQRRRVYKPAYEEALVAARLNPRDSASWRLAGTAALDDNLFVEAEAALRRAVALDPRDFHARLSLGNALFELSRFPEAADSLREAIRLAPEEATAHLSLARVLLSQAKSPRDFDAVRQTLQRAVALRSDIPYVPLYLGKSYARQARWKEALPPLEQAARLDPQNAETQFELSRVYRRLGKAAKAEAAARRQKELIAAQQDARKESAYKQSR